MGLSKILSIILLILITIAILSLLWLFLNSIFGKANVDVETPFKTKGTTPEGCTLSENGEAIILLKNTGSETIYLAPPSEVAFNLIKNMPQNTNFEIDSNNDGVPDGWDTSEIKADIVLTTDLSESMQRCMDSDASSFNCPASGGEAPKNCRQDIPCSFNNCSSWIDGRSEAYCSNYTAYRKTTYAKNNNGLLGRWSFDEGPGNITAKDSSGNGNTGTLKNMNTNGDANSGWTASGAFGNALKFDGIDDYVEIPSINPRASITVSAWVKSADYTGYSGTWQLVSKYGAYILGTNSFGGKNISFIIYNGSNWYDYGNYYAVPNPDAWHYFAGTFDNSTHEQKLYVDGILVNTKTVYGSITPDTGPIHIGHRECCPGTGNYSKVIIDEVRIWGRALTSDEIRGAGSCITTNDAVQCSDSNYPIPAEISPIGSETLLSSCNPANPFSNGSAFDNCESVGSAAACSGSSACAGIGKVYNGTTTVTGTNYRNENCHAGECYAGNTSSSCSYVARTANGCTASCAAGTFYNGTSINSSTAYRTDCNANECGTGSYGSCIITNNRATCGGPNQCPTTPAPWHNVTYFPGTYYNKLTACGASECYGGKAYANCAWVARTNGSKTACSPPDYSGYFDRGDRNDSITWRASCLQSEYNASKRNVTACIGEVSNCGDIPGYFTCSEGNNLQCNAGYKGCCIQNSYEYQCVQSSDNCCQTEYNQCRQESDKCCETKQCASYSDACCAVSQRICNTKTYQCCSRPAKCFRQTLKCCPDTASCEQANIIEAESCEGYVGGYSNGPPSVSENNCNTASCEGFGSCSYCSSVAINLAKKVDKNFTSTIISAGHNAGLVSYGTNITNWTAPTGETSAVFGQIDTYKANANKTCISCALNKSIELLKNSPNKKFIVLVTDGVANVFNNGTADPSEIAATREAIDLGCKAYNDYGIVVHTIGFGNAAGTDALKAIAQCAHGQFSNGSAPADLEQTFHDIALQIIGQLDNSKKVYGNNSLKMISGQNYGAESRLLELAPANKYLLANHIMLDVNRGDFFVEVNIYNSTKSKIGNKTLKSYDAGWSGFKKESYTFNVSDYSGAKYGKIIYRWWNGTATPDGTAWVDDIFLGPVITCNGSAETNGYGCGDISIKKIEGYGDIYPFISDNAILPYKTAWLKDANCMSKTCGYLVCSPACKAVFCKKE